MSLKIFETHSHYYDDSFLHDRDEVIERQFNYGVKKILNCAVDIDSCKKQLILLINMILFMELVEYIQVILNIIIK